jgi:hypothetical protein
VLKGVSRAFLRRHLKRCRTSHACANTATCGGGVNRLGLLLGRVQSCEAVGFGRQHSRVLLTRLLERLLSQNSQTEFRRKHVLGLSLYHRHLVTHCLCDLAILRYRKLVLRYYGSRLLAGTVAKQR